jgi:hypothetical protein
MLEARIKARKAGEKRFEGIRCASCHTTTKYTSSGSCVKCAGIRRDKDKKRPKVKPTKPPHSKDASPIGELPKPPKILKPWPAHTDFSDDEPKARIM